MRFRTARLVCTVLLLLQSGSLLAQEAPASPAAAPVDFPLTLGSASPAPAEEPFVHDRSSRVTILGYHRFDKKKADSLSTSASELRAQLEAVQDAGIEFISMADFLAWRRGEVNIPPLSCLVTIDDGFNSIATIADPIFREFKVPYSVAAYVDYVGAGGKALTWDQLRKLHKEGVDMGSHSASHQAMSGLKSPMAPKGSAQPHLESYKLPAAFGSDLKQPRDLLARMSVGMGSSLGGATALAGVARWSKVGLARDVYEEWLWDEVYGSRQRFFKELGQYPTTFTYPFGIFSDRVAEVVREAGYEAAFTVNGDEVTILTPMDRLHRFIVQSDKPEIFQNALKFRVLGATPQGDPAELPPGATVHPVRHQRSANRVPEISAYMKPWLVSGVEADPASFNLRLSGFGTAPFTYDPATGLLSASVPTTLRGASHTAVVTGTSIKGEKLTLRWSFLLPGPTEAVLAGAR